MWKALDDKNQPKLFFNVRRIESLKIAHKFCDCIYGESCQFQNLHYLVINFEQIVKSWLLVSQENASSETDTPFKITQFDANSSNFILRALQKIFGQFI